MAQQLAVSPLRLSQGGGIFVGGARIGPAPANNVGQGGGDRAARAHRQRQVRANERPPHNCPYYCPFCKHCQKIKHLINNGLPQLDLGPEAYYDRIRNQAQDNNQAPAQDHQAQDQGQDGAEGGEPEEGRVEVEEGMNIDEPVAEDQPLAEINVAGEEIEDLVANLVAETEINISGRLIPLNISSNLHTPPSSFDLTDINVPNNSAASMDFENEVLDTPLIINRVPDVTPAPPKRCHKDCRCCVPSCPCSKTPSNVPVLQAKCICICHKKSRKSRPSSASNYPSADGSGPSTSADNNNASYELPDPSNNPQRDHQRRGRINSGHGGSFTETEQAPHNRTKRAKETKSIKRKRVAEDEEEQISPKSFKQYAPEAVARNLGDAKFKNAPDGSKVPYALRCLGFKRIPDILEPTGLRRSKRIAVKNIKR